MLEIVKTADGSNTIFNSEVGENYHSRHGALQESKHVFLNAGLLHFLELHNSKTVSVLEVGFGTGLNFLLTADYCLQNHIQLNYTGIEAYPLTNEMISQTDYDEYVSLNVWDKFIAAYETDRKIMIEPQVQLYIAHSSLLEYTSAEQFDVIYFDAFASVHQPEMWDETAITHTLRFLKPGGVFVTYAITGNLKRIIKGLGLKVEKAPGAPGKREMLRAAKPQI